MENPEAAGWYDDPDDPEQLQYFDGIVWSGRRVPKKAPVRAPEPPAPAPGGGRAAEPPVTWRHESGHQVTGEGTGRPTPAAKGAAPLASDGRPLAGFGLRLVSGFVDLLVVALLSAITSGWAWVLWIADYWRFAFEQVQSGDPAAVERMSPEQVLSMLDMRWFGVAVAITVAVASLYHLVMLARTGRTLGKIATRTRVRPVGGPDRPLGWGVAQRRVGVSAGLWLLTCIPVISWFVFPLLVIDHLLPLADKHRQTLHDKAARTEVVETAEPARGPAGR